jgi:hypothetical protein
MPLARPSSIRRVAVAAVAVLIAGLCAVVSLSSAKGATSPTPPGPHNQAQAIADGKAAGPLRSNIPSKVAAAPEAPAGQRAASMQAAAAAGAGARIGGFVSFHVYATQYAPNTQGSVEVAVPDQCVKFAALKLTQQMASVGCRSAGYPLNSDYRVFVSSDDTGKNAYIPVKDTGPWNIDDNYWDLADPNYPRPRRKFTDLPQGTPESQAAFYNDYNNVSNCKDLNNNFTGHGGGADQFGRCVLNPSAIDLSFAAASQLGMGGSGWVTVTYLWEPLAPGYVLDAWGGIHPYGGAPSVTGPGYWPGQNIVRGITRRSDLKSGYKVDRSGGIFPYGGAPNVSGTGYWANQDIVRGISLDPSDPNGSSGYVVDRSGGIFPFGGAPAVKATGYWGGQDIVRGIVTTGRGSGFVVDRSGGIFPFGNAPNVRATGYWPGQDVVRGITALDGGRGYVVDRSGGIFPFGGAPAVKGTGYWPGHDVVRGIEYGPGLAGGYVVDLYGGIHEYGAAPAAIGSWYAYGKDLARGIAG